MMSLMVDFFWRNYLYPIFRVGPCADDQVWMSDQNQLDEYVFNEQGTVYSGCSDMPGCKPWKYGQVSIQLDLKGTPATTKHSVAYSECSDMPGSKPWEYGQVSIQLNLKGTPATTRHSV